MGWEIIFALSLYEDRKGEFLRSEIVGRREELDALAGRFVVSFRFDADTELISILSSSLSSMNLPGSIEASIQPIGLPPSLLSKSAELRENGGSEKIRIMMQDVRELYRQDRKMVDSVRPSLFATTMC